MRVRVVRERYNNIAAIRIYVYYTHTYTYTEYVRLARAFSSRFHTIIFHSTVRHKSFRDVYTVYKTRRLQPHQQQYQAKRARFVIQDEKKNFFPERIYYSAAAEIYQNNDRLSHVSRLYTHTRTRAHTTTLHYILL